MKNNLFMYATKELSQDAFFCWLINWINYPSTLQYTAGVTALNLFLGENKKDSYYNVEVKRQYKKIDVLVLFNDSYALIIEDKTNTTEHGEQIARYKRILEADYPDRKILTAYIKTGIMYDEDTRMINKVDCVVTLTDLLTTLKPLQSQISSEIFDDYVEYIDSLEWERAAIRGQIASRKYGEALTTYYGQFAFLDQIFSERTKGIEAGKTYIEKDRNPTVLYDYVYAGTNNGGTPWTQYCFWAQQYPEQFKIHDRIEYHYLFWRIDCNGVCVDNGMPNFYIALRHYDENTKANEKTRGRKKDAYQGFRGICADLERKYAPFLKKIGTRENYKESDLLFIPLERIAELSFEEIKEMLLDITEHFRRICPIDTLHSGNTI